jgi:hypothetical protein
VSEAIGSLLSCLENCGFLIFSVAPVERLLAIRALALKLLALISILSRIIRLSSIKGMLLLWKKSGLTLLTPFTLRLHASHTPISLSEMEMQTSGLG